jgi:hypothetical protein
MNKRLIYFSVILGFILSNCASTYKVINPNSLNYTNKQNCNEKFEVSYLYDIYSLTENSKYSKKEKSNGFRTIAVKVKNITDSSRMITTDNFKIYQNDNEVTFANKSDYFNSVSQTSASYLLHGLWGPWSFETISDENGNSQTTVRYYFIGLIVGVINMIVASSANTNHENEIKNCEIYGKTIKPGETITGIVIIKSSQYDPLIFRYLDK